MTKNKLQLLIYFQILIPETRLKDFPKRKHQPKEIRFRGGNYLEVKDFALEGVHTRRSLEDLDKGFIIDLLLKSPKAPANAGRW